MNTHTRNQRAQRLIFVLALCTSPLATAFIDGSDRTLQQWGSYGEWTLANPSFGGNPFDLVASATFTHAASGETRTTPMFYAGGNQWKFRFTATRLGSWTLATSSADSDLNGWTGSVSVTQTAQRNGFVSFSGRNWIHGATGEVFVPQYLMYAGPQYFGTNDVLIDAEIDRFTTGHGFTGFHIPVYCRWFEITKPRCDEIVTGSDPDPRTFDALEAMLRRGYAKGAVMHIWAWGDSGRQQNQTALRVESGINGPADLRLQRYIAARLGPLPGWTMGYGYDLFEWVNGGELTFWRNNLQSLMGWRHLLGARGTTNTFFQPSEAMDYASYETHRPTIEVYRQSIAQRPAKPAFSEDRFRFRGVGNKAKDYSLEEVRRGLWHSAIAGGIANIWGNLTTDNVTEDDGINEAFRPSLSFPNVAGLLTYALYFERRFDRDMIACDAGATYCVRRANNAARTLYQEDTRSLALNLAGHAGSLEAIAVDTKRAYAEVNLGTLSADTTSLTLPYESDWVVAIGWAGNAEPPADPPPDDPPPGAADTLAPAQVRGLSVD
ncbi:MAG: DUF5060 domain-containing protein [Pseudomonadota bacterium]